MSDPDREKEVAVQLTAAIMEDGEVVVDTPEDTSAALQLVEAARLHIYERHVLQTVHRMGSAENALQMFGGE